VFVFSKKSFPLDRSYNKGRHRSPTLIAKIHPPPGDGMQTDRMTSIAFALALALTACGGSPKNGGTIGGEGGGEETGGDTGSPGTGGKPSSTGGSPGTGGATSSTGGATGTGGATSSTGGATGTGGSTDTPDAGPATGGSSGEGGAGGTVSAGHTGALGWYEAEAMPPNTLFGGTKIATCGAGACQSTGAIKEGMECCAGGKKLSQLLRGKGGAVFNNVMAPSDGMYDVTWWFHCGKNDNFGDTGCGGLPHTASGCRPHVFEINGAKFPKVYHLPCFPGSWGEIHASTVTMPLKAGMNSISVKATTGRDAADLDAIEVFPSGKGFPPNVPGTNN
jgi:hypothetical protein